MEDGATQTLSFGTSREIDKQETIEILNKAQEEGLILQPTNIQKPISICACCGDCCHFLTAVKKLPRPVDYFATNYYSEVDENLCTGCSTCVERCQMGALTLVDNVSHVNLDFCIGCGNCVSNCPSNAIHLVKKSKELVPPKDTTKLFIKILIKKNGFIGTLKMLGRMLLGMRI
jgi:ferredoxin